MNNRSFRSYHWRAPDEEMARKAVFAAIANGVIKEATSMRCVHCGKTATTYIWPEGYSTENWLTVEPVCGAHRPNSAPSGAREPSRGRL